VGQLHLHATSTVRRGIEQIKCEAHFVILAGKYWAEMPQRVVEKLSAAFVALPNAPIRMFRAKDAARCEHLPAPNHAALPHREATVAARTHTAELAMNAHLLALEAGTLTGSETVVFDSVSDASLLLVELVLHNRFLRLFRGGGLRKCHGGRCSECRHKYELDESHGASPSVTAVADFAPGLLTLAETPHLQFRCVKIC
jgi:hypothetical protein